MKTMHRFSRQSPSGAVLLETVIALPVLFATLVVVADVGRVIAVKSALSIASRHGAHIGSLSSPLGTTATNWQTNVEAAVLDQLDNCYWYSAAKLTLDVPSTVDCNGVTCCRVSMSYDFESLFSLAGIGPTITVTESALLPMVR